MPGVKVVGEVDDPSTYTVFTSSGLPAGTIAIPNATSTKPGVSTAAAAFTFPATTGVPATTPAAGTPAFDKATGILYIYNGTAWVSTLLTIPV